MGMYLCRAPGGFKKERKLSRRAREIENQLLKS